MFRKTTTILLSGIVASLLWASGAEAAALHFDNGGLQIDAGSMGQFTLNYPALLNDAHQPAHALTSKSVSGDTATLTYDGGGSLTLQMTDGGHIHARFAHMPADVKMFRMDMLIDFGYSRGGTWKVSDDPAKPFPAEKPTNPNFFQGSTQTFTLTNYEGKALAFSVPAYSYQQLTDNRAWGWKVYHWEFNAPYNPNQGDYGFAITDNTPAGLKPVILVDRFGQTAQADFPQKVAQESELKQDIQSEDAFNATLTPPRRDLYGGLPGSGKTYGLKPTGFFHMARSQGRWILVDPAGNAFFQLGICEFGLGDDYTYIKGRESAYAWLPPQDGAFATAYLPDQGGTAFSFYVANLIRKYDRPYDPDAFAARMIARTRQWGFNSGGPFSGAPPAFAQTHFPYVMMLPINLGDIPGISGTFDPFDPQNRATLKKNFAADLPGRSGDPLLIGYFLTNEPLYEDIPHVVPTLDGKYACKRRLVQFLQSKYVSIDRFNSAWSTQAKTFDDLNDMGLPVTAAAAAADLHAFTGLFFQTYYQLVADAFHQYDKHHLLIGNRFQSGTINNEQLCRIAGKYLDVMSFNYYTYGLDTDFLKRIYGWTGRPMLLSEYFFDSPSESGLSGGGLDLKSEHERGLAYRSYVETAASLGFVVGCEWFTLVDQAASGRWFQKYNGESANSGLIGVTDRPWKDMIREAARTNDGIYQVALGKRPPFRFDDPRFSQQASADKSAVISHASGPVALDGTAAGFPGVPAEPISSKRLVQGADAGGVEGSYKVCWDDTNLYVLVNVTDPTPMKNAYTGDTIWSGDAIELFVGSENVGQGGPLLPSDRQVLLSAGRVNGQPQSHIVGADRQDGVRLTVVPNVDGKGYTLEAAIPFARLGFVPKAGRAIRFDIGIDDSEDGAHRARQFLWNGNARDSGDRTGWGRARFVP